ncbi:MULTISPECIES: TolC family protein [unclassified Kaistella]|uniref:TolC family protein n=1 Tax=unclassified Kaistella TaxID=2762626 RepID=UPI002735AF0D|nr:MULTISPECIES: TolC family protein [unclassified Kaistella]MDP2454017.1 TolC family protein [Kaistella sp. SH11-4b]MDP2457074.1 TolC family protein [Kaistella sp. SH40-3]MDP2459831.1 TolC family protein [Kaistella sp. SH19-2b]
MKKIYSSIVVLGFSAIGITAQAQAKILLTLDEAVRLGIQNSKNLKIDQAKIEEATANYLEAKNNRLPSLKVSGSALALGNANVDLKVLKPSENGGSAAPKANSAFYGNVSASLPLYTGGKIKYGIQSAEYLIEASKLSTENDKLAIAYTISQAYNNLFKASQQIKVLEDNLTASQKRDESFQKLENNGIIARNDKLKANLQTSNIELQLLEANNNFNIANINMDILLGLPDATEIEIDPNYISELTENQPVSFYLNQAVSQRKDVQALDYQRRAAELGTKAAKAESLPTIALTGGYVAAEIPKILTITNAANIGLGIQYNIDNLWKKNSSLMRATATEKQLSASNELLTDQIKLEINRDYQNSEFAKRKITVYEKAAAQANENFRVTKNKFDNGLATITELLDADTAQISANVNVVNAKADAALAYRKLLQTTGTLTLN